MRKERIAVITLWATRVVALVVISLIFALPKLLGWYAALLGYMPRYRDFWAVVIAFDCCAAFIVAALWNLEKLMRNILKREIFIRENVVRVSRVRWCCGIVALICLVATVFALPMLLFAAIMGFLCLVVSVVASVLDAAVALREENDLTI